MDQETLDAFLTELTALSQKYNIEIGGCGCCQSPWLAPVDCTDRVYTADGPSAGMESEVCRYHSCERRTLLHRGGEIMHTTYYIVRNKHTRAYFHWCGRGSTAQELATEGTVPPRLFVSARSAKCALKWWLRGAFHEEHHRSGSILGELDDYVNLICSPRPERKAEDMEIVPIKLIPGGES